MSMYCKAAIAGAPTTGRLVLAGLRAQHARPRSAADESECLPGVDARVSEDNPEIDGRKRACSASASPRTLHSAWDRLDRIGLEVAEVEITGESIACAGTVVVEDGGRPLRLRYSIFCNASWEFLHGTLAVETAGSRRTLSIDRTGGRWHVNNVWRRDLERCRDIDIAGTPSTNSLPVRRLTWNPNESRDLQMAFIGLPNLDVSAMTQRYSRLSDDDSGMRRFQYENVSSGFRAELVVDPEGLVLSYPPSWRRTPGVAG
jgi:uncharacterized protein